MMQNGNELLGYSLAALDGDIGHVEDFYFDDESWVIRYLVVDTGTWLTGRRILLTPHSIGTVSRSKETIGVQLRKKQIEESPSIETHTPVSRQHEIDHYRYYGWPAYWDGDAMWGLASYPILLPPSNEEMKALKKYHHRDDKHLRSILAVKGYHIQTADENIGRISDIVLDDRSWEIRQLVVDTGSWLSSKEILISPEMVERISYEESAIIVKLTKEEILQKEDQRIPSVK
jgi:uncharacterized protein YrrD